MLNRKKILLTGGNGFIGKNIQESFLSQKYEISAPRSYELDLISTESVDKYFEEKSFDVVVHAGVKPGHRNAKDPTNLFYSNLRMFENLERHKDKYKKFINISSGAIYDVSKNLTDAKEKDVFKNIPSDEHGFCKYVEHKLIEKTDSFVDLNIFGVFGKYEDYSIRFISNAICKTLLGLPMTIKQNRKFSYLYIEDLMPILDFFIENKPQYKMYNIVPDEKTELLEIANLIRNIDGKENKINVFNIGYGLDYTGSNTRLKSEFKEVKFTKLEDSVFQLYNYYKENINSIDKNLVIADK